MNVPHAMAGYQLGYMRTSVVEVEGMTGFLFTVGFLLGGFKKGLFLKSFRTASSVPSCATCGLRGMGKRGGGVKRERMIHHLFQIETKLAPSHSLNHVANTYRDFAIPIQSITHFVHERFL